MKTEFLNNKLWVYDRAISEDILSEAIHAAETNRNYGVLHGAGGGGYGFKYNWMFCHVNTDGVIESEPIKNLWHEVKNHLPVNSKLHRGYVNAHTYGVEDTIHQDDLDLKNGLTVIVYLCNAWYPEWFGQTLFFESTSNQENEIVKSIMPRPNRFIIFDKNIPHCVSPLSRRFSGIRLTCMFKVELLDDPT